MGLGGLLVDGSLRRQGAIVAGIPVIPVKRVYPAGARVQGAGCARVTGAGTRVLELGVSVARCKLLASGLSWNVGFSRRFGLWFGASGVVSAPRGGCDRYSGRFDIDSTLIRR